jgi:hypothetical protein
VDSAFLHGMKKMFNTVDDIKELIDPYVNFSFAGQQVRDSMNIFIFYFFLLGFIKNYLYIFTSGIQSRTSIGT